MAAQKKTISKLFAYGYGLGEFGFTFFNFLVASAGEYGGITVIAANSGLWMMVLMTLIINARYFLMSCALSQRLAPDTPLAFRLLIGFDVTDELFGIAKLERKNEDRCNHQANEC